MREVNSALSAGYLLRADLRVFSGDGHQAPDVSEYVAKRGDIRPAPVRRFPFTEADLDELERKDKECHRNSERKAHWRLRVLGAKGAVPTGDLGLWRRIRDRVTIDHTARRAAEYRRAVYSGLFDVLAYVLTLGLVFLLFGGF